MTEEVDTSRESIRNPYLRNDEDTHINLDVCDKTNENDTACRVVRTCSSSYQYCPLIQNEQGVIICTLAPKAIDQSVCYRSCHDKGYVSVHTIGADPKCTKKRRANGEPVESLPSYRQWLGASSRFAKLGASSHFARLGESSWQSVADNVFYYTFNIQNLDRFKTLLKPSNLPSDPGCTALNVSDELCDDFTRYRILYCGGSSWKQVQCYMGNCDADAWPVETTSECRYASVLEGVAICPALKYIHLSCRFICDNKNASNACSKKPKRYLNTKKGRQSIRDFFNVQKKDWKDLAAL